MSPSTVSNNRRSSVRVTLGEDPDREAPAEGFMKALWCRLPRWAQVTVKVVALVILLSLWWLLAYSARDSFLP